MHNTLLLFYVFLLVKGTWGHWLRGQVTGRQATAHSTTGHKLSQETHPWNCATCSKRGKPVSDDDDEDDEDKEEEPEEEPVMALPPKVGGGGSGVGFLKR